MDWLKLTVNDIELAVQEARKAPPTPAAIRIGMEDLGPDQPNELGRQIIQIREEDFLAAPPQESADTKLESYERLMLGLLNEARCRHLPRWLGRAAVQWHPGLAAVARGHSVDMLQRQYVAHDAPEGVSAANRIERFGIRYLACGENIGVVYGTNSHSERGIYDIHGAFMNQPQSLTNHRGNVLNPIWTHVGVGGAYREDGALIITQNFISAPGVRLSP